MCITRTPSSIGYICWSRSPTCPTSQNILYQNEYSIRLIIGCCPAVTVPSESQITKIQPVELLNNVLSGIIHPSSRNWWIWLTRQILEGTSRLLYFGRNDNCKYTHTVGDRWTRLYLEVHELQSSRTHMIPMHTATVIKVMRIALWINSFRRQASHVARAGQCVLRSIINVPRYQVSLRFGGQGMCFEIIP